MEVIFFSNRADWCHIMASTFLKGGTECGNNWVKTPIYPAPAIKELKHQMNKNSTAAAFNNTNWNNWQCICLRSAFIYFDEVSVQK